MTEIFLRAKGGEIDDRELATALRNSLPDDLATLKKVLIVPPDFTRLHSGAGKITAMYYDILHKFCRVDVLPALGTHEAMTVKEFTQMFGEKIPPASVINHDWRHGVEEIGEVPAKFVKRISEGLLGKSIPVEINRELSDPSYELILSVGQVVPHEVAGMANYTKNILIGCGGKEMIDSSHMLGAVYGMEKIMGRDHSPVRRVLDYAQEHFLRDLPLCYVLTVTGYDGSLQGLFIGKNRRVFEEAVRLSQEKNLTFCSRPFTKIVVYLDEKEFKTTWLGNKAIYRTRMAIADGGKLIILGPGIRKFGEDSQIDALIRKYGYVGRKKILQFCEENEDMQNNLSVAAHLIHGSADNRFSVFYAVDKMSREEIEGVAFGYMPLKQARGKYPRESFPQGVHDVDGEEVLFIHNPSLGLWLTDENLAK